MAYDRGTVVKGPDLLANNDSRPYVRLSDETHPFSDEEAVYTAVTTTRRSIAIPLSQDDFETGGLPRESYVNPWTIVTIRHADMGKKEGQLNDEVVKTITSDAADYLGVR